MTEGGDLRYRIFYKSYEGVIEDLVPLDRVESHLVMEDGVIICELPGKCKIFVIYHLGLNKMNNFYLFIYLFF